MNKSEYKKPTAAQEIDAWRDLAVQVNFAFEISNSVADRNKILLRLSDYAVVAATDRNKAFWTYVKGDPEAGKK